ncbi:putative monovalent cation/H+ antiporter subunit D [Marvinbryantia formatexigens DSM 14469]|uniref:Monovalent cation/H+ antiporter subunit D n=1 Tax=Marvinbryantia formatexigens DSM 14469 TaxID=478749 RepID=C6LML9_9FIRM|nr:proton-conducting transporter membrane subunit [Marvinbryantia formatexigens]EET58124.1 putative monovalent cation/H+ antiporter subunit D [Marvinbryantia formatexigens DSM 14469]UWO24857.1 sodium:proton antiporter [Marvinbryantia formatexigens DSM 14469]SDG78617.1 multisubunit sodium/proton antiporter, MrpD subunit [Marvinbryantia formatexigens]
MAFVQNVPFFSIMISMFSGIVSSVLPGKAAKWLNTAAITVVGVMSAWLLGYMLETGGSYTYMMGHFPAPWGNEIRAGALEAAMALAFCIVMLLSMLGGRKKLDDEVEKSKHNIYYILTDLLLSSLLALIYTNDLFTAYVFVEINTISACGLIMIRQNGRTIEAAVRYMIMSLLGSGLLLMGICMLYDLTGHLLMSNIREQVEKIMEAGTYRIPMIITIGLITVGLSIKSALFPFHSWLPDAYGYSTVSSAAMLSSLVSKGYIFLLIKIFYRVIGFDIICASKIINVLFVFGLCGMIFGSVSAIMEKDVRRMISFSSVAQIGYIYMGFGLGTTEGVVASIFHILAHSATKSLLFISAIGLTDVSAGSRSFFALTGAGYRNKIAGVGFTVGSLSMVGVPIFAGFVSKLLFAEAAVLHPTMKMLPTLIVLAISTILNAIYFLKTVIRIYVPEKKSVIAEKGYTTVTMDKQKLYTFTIVMFVLLNMALGMMSEPILHIMQTGLSNFA